MPGKQTGIHIEVLSGKLSEKQKNKRPDKDGEMDKQKDCPWQADKKFPKQAERRLEAKTGRQVLARRTGLPCRQVCHADMFAMQTDFPCRQVCHVDRFAMQTGRSSPVLTDNIHVELLPRRKEKKTFVVYHTVDKRYST